MRIVLFYPRGKPYDPGGPGAADLAAVLPPLGLASIAAVLRSAGHEVAILDGARLRGVPNQVWAERIAAAEPDFVGFSANTPAFLDAYDVCRGVKEAYPEARTVFGGVHTSWGRESLLRDFEAIDYLVAGEGEYAFRRLAAGEDPRSIPGLYYRDGSSVLFGPIQDKASLCTMDDLPFPAYDLIDGFPREYRLPLFSYGSHPGAHIISSRGCVYQCSYCDRSVFQRSFRWNSPEYTFELVKLLHRDYGVRHVYFYDDLFTLNRKRVATLCGLLEKARLDIRFNCIVRIGHIDKELIGLLRSGGCWMVNVGIESGDQRILDDHKEGLRVEDIRRDVQQLHEAGLYVKGLFMMGFPGETEESIRKTIDFAVSLPLKDANVTAFTPYPGAPVSQYIDQAGEFEDDWSKMDCVNFVFRPHGVPSRELLESYYRKFLTRFYRRPFMRRMYRKMLLESPHSYWRLLRHGGAFLTYARGMKKRATR